jgi:hypothetical protein
VGIDLDGCREERSGRLTDAAEALVESFDTYTEVSVSGRGLHLLMHGEVPEWAGTKKRLDDLSVEVYATARFLVMTGVVLRDQPIQERRQEVQQLCALLWPERREDTPPAPSGGPSGLSDDVLLGMASEAQNGAKFAALMAGEWEDDYNSRSEADAALLVMLGWWSGGDREQMERLWLSSGLYRDKLKRDDYRRTSIDAACMRLAANGGSQVKQAAPVEQKPVYWRVGPGIWRKSWSEDARLLALYILTNGHRTSEGLFYLPKGYICADLGWTPKRLDGPFRELLDAGFIEYDEAASVVLIVKAMRWQRPENPNNRKHAAKKLAGVPVSYLFCDFMDAAQVYAPEFAEALPELLPERFPHPPAPSPTPAPAPAPTYSQDGASLFSDAANDLDLLGEHEDEVL